MKESAASLLNKYCQSPKKLSQVRRKNNHGYDNSSETVPINKTHFS